MRDEGQVQNRAVHLAIGINMEGNKEVLGMWSTANEGAKFWLQVLTDIRNRGVKDIFIACVDGLKGFPAAIETVFPETQVQLCIVHMVRASLNYVSWKKRRELAGDLRQIYTVFASLMNSFATDCAEIATIRIYHKPESQPRVVNKSARERDRLRYVHGVPDR